MNFASGAADAAKKSIAVGNAAAAATGTKIKDGAFKFFSRK